MLGIIRHDKNMPISILALSIPGLLMSIYHNIIYWKFVPDTFSPCAEGVSCTTKYFEWFGFITIPSLSLFAFIAITLIAFICVKKNRNVII
jgi:disulfide bond formation protein DsbB